MPAGESTPATNRTSPAATANPRPTTPRPTSRAPDIRRPDRNRRPLHVAESLRDSTPLAASQMPLGGPSRRRSTFGDFRSLRFHVHFPFAPEFVAAELDAPRWTRPAAPSPILTCRPAPCLELAFRRHRPGLPPLRPATKTTSPAWPRRIQLLQLCHFLFRLRQRANLQIPQHRHPHQRILRIGRP